jgi:hypothetical protein
VSLEFLRHPLKTISDTFQQNEFFIFFLKFLASFKPIFSHLIFFVWTVGWEACLFGFFFFGREVGVKNIIYFYNVSLVIFGQEYIPF